MDEVAGDVAGKFVDVPGPLACKKPAIANIAAIAHRKTRLMFMAPSFSLGYPCCLAIEAVANDPPSPMVSTAEDGTMTIEPLSLIAS